MKKFAKLVLTFSISFVIIMLIATVLRFLALRVDWAKSLPTKPETTQTLMIAAAHWALSLSLFATILFSVSYAFRRKFFAPIAIVIIMGLSYLFCSGVSLALNKWKTVPPAQSEGIPLGEKGLILSSSLNRDEFSVVLLGGAQEPLGPRVTLIPGHPMVFHEAASFTPGRTTGENAPALPSIPFGDNTPPFLKSLAIDLRLNAESIAHKFDNREHEEAGSFIVHVGALIFFLCALAYAIKFSAWPLANLFLGILAFRGVLTLETFFNTSEMQDIIGSFFKDVVPVSLAIPLIFFLLGSILHVYSILIYLSKRRPKDGY